MADESENNAINIEKNESCCGETTGTAEIIQNECNAHYQVEEEEEDNDVKYAKLVNTSNKLKEEQQNVGFKKKAKMRTATEVISRILWDSDLTSENFTIGYLDRFIGLTEKPFQYFSWEDLASVDYNVLAIPKHRIVYFKYRDVKVWDKNERLDLVFNSTTTCSDVESSPIDIRELVKQIDEEHLLKESQQELNETESIYDDDDSTGEESELDIQVSGTSQNVRLNLPNARPNYFVAIRVTEPEVVQNVKLVKERICEKEPRLRDLMIPDSALHITLAMLKLDDITEVDNAHTAIQACREKLVKYFTQPLVVHLKNMTTFGSYVLYVEVKAPDAFYQMHNTLLEHLLQHKVRLAHAYDFVPHLTILKLTRGRVQQLQNPFIDPYVYVEHKETDFGKQECDNLHLCEIGTTKRFDGFYNCPSEIHFT